MLSALRTQAATGVFFTFQLFGDIHELGRLKLALQHKAARKLRMHRSDDDKLKLRRSSESQHAFE